MRLLIVEDEEDLAGALAKGLRRQGYAVDLALDGMEGLELTETYEYDLLILDLNLPGVDGLEVCRRVRASQPQLPILILTARGHTSDLVTGLDLGADDYVSKPFHWNELLARVRALLRRNVPAREPMLRCGNLVLDPTMVAVWLGGRRLDLRSKELSLLEYLLRNMNRVVSQQELMEHVWDVASDPLSNTVRVHINSLRRKLDEASGRVAGATGAGAACEGCHIETVVGRGYMIKSGGVALGPWGEGGGEGEGGGGLQADGEQTK